MHFFSKMEPAQDIVSSWVELNELAVYKGVKSSYIRAHAIGEHNFSWKMEFKGLAFLGAFEPKTFMVEGKNSLTGDLGSIGML